MSELELLKREQKYEYNQQREILKVLLPNFGIPVIHLSDWEGDDIIYILTLLTKDSIVLSDDKDLLQLVCDESNRKCCVKRGMRNEFVDISWFKDNDITIEDFIARKAIVGDPSDNIPSACFQVGEKTALALIELYTKSKAMVGGFPKDEKELDEKCKRLGISKRKAYLNFNEEQYLTNIRLMDLRFVQNEIDGDLIKNINNLVTENLGYTNISNINNILETLNIQTFIPRNLLNNLERSIKYITEKPENKNITKTMPMKLF